MSWIGSKKTYLKGKEKEIVVKLFKKFNKKNSIKKRWMNFVSCIWMGNLENYEDLGWIDYFTIVSIEII